MAPSGGVFKTIQAAVNAAPDAGAVLDDPARDLSRGGACR